MRSAQKGRPLTVWLAKEDNAMADASSAESRTANLIGTEFDI